MNPSAARRAAMATPIGDGPTRAKRNAFLTLGHGAGSGGWDPVPARGRRSATVYPGPRSTGRAGSLDHSDQEPV